jgi:hypothetical protein
MRKSLKWIGIILLLVFAIAQFIPAKRSNPPSTPAQSIDAIVHVPPGVHAILTRACADCHSNQSVWPWYSHVQPTSWFVVGHVDNGRRHINFSTWVRPGKEPQDSIDRLKAMCREVQEGNMPLASYLLIHWDAKLSAGDTKLLCDWSAEEQQRLRSIAPQN